MRTMVTGGRGSSGRPWSTGCSPRGTRWTWSTTCPRARWPIWPRPGRWRGEPSPSTSSTSACPKVELVALRRPEVVFHLAAQADVRVSVERPAFDAEVNVLGSLGVLEGARRAGARRGGLRRQRGHPLRRGRPGRPARPRVAAPPAAVPLRGVEESRDRLPRRLPRAPLAGVLRPGPGQRLRPPPGPPRRGRGGVHLRPPPGGREPVTIFGDGEQTRDFVFVDDVVDAFVRGAARGGGLVCNVGTGREPRSTPSTPPWPRRPGWTPRRVRAGPARGASAQLARDRAGGHAARLAALDRARRRRGGRARVRRAPGRLSGPPQRKRSSAGRRTTSAATEPSRRHASGTAIRRVLSSTS